MAADEVSVTDVVLNCPWEAESMSISDLLMSQKRWGAARCRRLLTPLGIPENKRVGTFTDRQRRALAAMLPAVPRSKTPSAPSNASKGRTLPSPRFSLSESRRRLTVA